MTTTTTTPVTNAVSVYVVNTFRFRSPTVFGTGGAQLGAFIVPSPPVVW